MPAICLLAVCALSCMACSAVRLEIETPATGRVTNTIGESTPHEIRPAHIWEIDGEPVMYQRRSFVLAPGEHLIRVWPEGPAQRMVPDLAAIEEEGIQVDAIRLRVEAGHRYLLGARVTRSRTLVTVSTVDGTRTEYGAWAKTVEPVVVKDVPPAELEEAVKSFGGFFASLALGPLIGGGAG